MCEKALVGDNKPKEVELISKKEYYYCTCGRSSDEPFCDGSHKGSGCEPQKFSVDETKGYHICLCKSSSNPPFCDGSHSIYGVNDIGKKVQI